MNFYLYTHNNKNVISLVLLKNVETFLPTFAQIFDKSILFGVRLYSCTTVPYTTDSIVYHLTKLNKFLDLPRKCAET